MKVVDISMPLADGMPRYPSPYIPDVRLTPVARHETEGRSVHVLTCGTHLSTHIDAPFHAVPGGKTLEQVPVSHFIGIARQVRFSGRDRSRPLDAKDVVKIPDVDRCEKLILHTGWGDRTWGTSDYFTEGPFLTRDAARALAELPRLHLLGMDFPNIDRIEDMKIGTPAPNHQILLGKDIVLLENLMNLSEVDEYFYLSAVPPRLVGSDGCPCRAVAVFPLRDMKEELSPGR